MYAIKTESGNTACVGQLCFGAGIEVAAIGCKRDVGGVGNVFAITDKCKRAIVRVEAVYVYAFTRLAVGVGAYEEVSGFVRMCLSKKATAKT